MDWIWTSIKMFCRHFPKPFRHHTILNWWNRWESNSYWMIFSHLPWPTRLQFLFWIGRRIWNWTKIYCVSDNFPNHWKIRLKIKRPNNLFQNCLVFLTNEVYEKFYKFKYDQAVLLLILKQNISLNIMLVIILFICCFSFFLIKTL